MAGPRSGYWELRLYLEEHELRGEEHFGMSWRDIASQFWDAMDPLQRRYWQTRGKSGWKATFQEMSNLYREDERAVTEGSRARERLEEEKKLQAELKELKRKEKELLSRIEELRIETRQERLRKWGTESRRKIREAFLRADRCCACLEEDVEVCTVPCFHAGMCGECLTKQVRTVSAWQSFRCAICKSIIGNWVWDMA
jgi:hypothetical protein